MRPISCVAARAHGIAHIYYVAGERRFVAMTSATDQEPIATAKCGQGGEPPLARGLRPLGKPTAAVYLGGDVEGGACG
jgi:hypothetical protein